MHKSLRISALLIAVLTAAGHAGAAGLGRLTVMSALGQPLKAEIDLLSVQPDEIGTLSARLASAESFRQARLERTDNLNNVRFSIEQRPNGQPVLRITSATPIGDPFIDMLIELNWSSGRILREYTLLLDPPSDAKLAPEPTKEVMPAATVSRPDSAKVPEQQTAADAAKSAEPKAEAGKPKPAAEARGSYGPVKSGETLRSVAGKVRYPDVAMEIMMAGLYEANKKSFARTNMNLLRKGQTLAIPEQSALLQMFSPKQAKDLIREHSQAWNEYRGLVADTAAKAEPAPVAKKEGATAGKITAAPVKPPVTPAPAQGQDVLKLSKGQPTPDAKALQRQQAMEEELAAKARTLKEATERVAQLEKTVKDMQQLVKLKDQQAAKQAPAAAPTPVQPAPPAKPEPAPAKPEPAPVKVEPPAKPATPAPVAAPAPEQESFLSSLLNPLYIGGAAAAGLLGLLLWGMLGKRRHRNLAQLEQSVIGSADDFKTAIFRSTVGAPPQSTQQTSVMTDYSRLGLGAIDTHEVDPIAEAEVYMAYGRDAQAEEILKEALSKDPQRHEIALKLLEIYASRRDTVSYETQASEIYAALAGKPTPLWEKIAEMGRGIDPENPLYQFRGEAHGFPQAPAHDFTADQWRDAPVSAPPVEASPPAPADDLQVEQEQAASDFEDLFREEPVKEEEPDTLPMKVADFDEAIDFGFEMEPEMPAVAPPAIMPSPTVVPPVDRNPFAEDPATLEPPAPEMPMESDIDVEIEDFDAPVDDFAPITQEATVADLATEFERVPATVPDIDFSDIDLELAKPLEPAGAIESAEAQAVAEVEPAVEPPLDPELWEEVNTKLDLSKAYLEMGDKDGAREILEEVLKEGDASQKALARDLIASAD